MDTDNKNKRSTRLKRKFYEKVRKNNIPTKSTLDIEDAPGNKEYKKKKRELKYGYDEDFE